MANAVFLCGECGKYFSTIGDIREHSCWGSAKPDEGDEAPVENDIATSSQLLTEDPNPAELDESYIKSQCYAYVDEGKWTDDGIKLLIQLFKEREGEFRNPEKKKKEVWESIAAEMNKEGYLFTTDQVDTKWRNLKKAYWRSKEAQAEIGCPSRFVYEDLLDEIYGHTLPKKLQISRVIPRVIRRALIRDGDVVGSRGPKRRLVDESTLLAKKRFTREFHDIAAVLEGMRDDRKKAEEERQKQEEERMRLAIQMHEEKMSVLKELVEMVGSLSRKSPFGDDD